MPQTRREFWENKINRNKSWDKEVPRFYKKEGWNIIRIWEHEINSNKIDNLTQRIYVTGSKELWPK